MSHRSFHGCVRIVALGLLGYLPTQSLAQPVALRSGSITLPTGFLLSEYHGTDSYPGEIRRADGTFVIRYDIGPMAGAHVHPGSSREYVWIITHQVRGLSAYSGLFLKDGRRWIATTILAGPGESSLNLPANFEALLPLAPDEARATAEFMVIIGSYQPNSRGELRKLPP